MSDRSAKPSVLRRVGLLAAAAVTFSAVGCETTSWLDPSETPSIDSSRTLLSGNELVVPILDDLNFGMTDNNAYFTQARPVMPEDLETVDEDYRIGPNDTLQVSVADLLAPGAAVPEVRRVTASGNISLPLLERPVNVEGLTEAQVVQAIRDAYEDEELLNNAQVSLVVLEARNRTFQVYGSVPQPSEYPILRKDFRLMDAMLQAGGVSPVGGIEFVYIIRSTADEAEVGDDGDSPVEPNDEGFDDLNPEARNNAGWDDAGLVAFQADDNVDFVPAEDATGEPGSGATEGRTMEIDGKEVELDAAIEGEAGEPLVDPGTLEDDPTTMPMAIEPLSDEELATQPAVAFDAPSEPDDIEVIKVPVNLLLRGQMKFNVAIKPGDFIYVAPPRSLGFYYMGGHFARVGVYSFSGQKLTITQATIAAGMLDPVAIPQRTMLVRYVSTPAGDFKVHARIDLAKIFAGQEPDIYLMPNDEIRVGTNALAPFIAAARNAFRITYGFGFLYDRNYARDDDNN